jgi:type IV pilus assembly protein PilM
VSDEQKQSVWKKEISFGRKAKDDAPAAPEDETTVELEAIKAAAVAAVSVDPPAPATNPVASAAPIRPQPEPVPVPAVEPVEQPAPAAATPEPVAEVVARELVMAATDESLPFWKREMSLSRKPKQPKAPKAAKQPKTPKQEKVKQPKAEKQPKEAKAKREPKPQKEQSGEAVPFWKREISVGKRTKMPKTATAASSGRGGLKLKLPRLERPARAKRGSHVPKRLVGLKIGASQIAAARVSNNGSAELVLAARKEIEPGIIVGGELREPEKLAEVLREFFKEHNLPKRNVRLGIANNRIGVRTFEIEGIDDAKQLDNAIRFRAQEALPIPIEDAVLDYQILSETKNEAGETVKKVLLVVAYRELVDRYVAACRKAGVELVGIDLEAFALLRAMAAPRDEALEADAAVVVVSVGHDRSTFAVSDGRVCEFTRVLEWGGSSLNIALARALNRAPSEVEAIKRSLNLNIATPPEGMSTEQFEVVREAALRQIQSFARELVSSLQFYQNQPASLGIGEIVLTGGTAHLPGLAEELQRLIGVTVRVGDPLMRVRVGKKAVEDDSQIGSLAVAIGLGIED